ncbi:hypothetical protein [Hymenobacter lapidiphilus]|uniref:Uncharacterized protein n=1 Tax=Hymenobacter lapidiphilus TaxID=2608003 RepID=A0A7Y7U5L5_9BACT|nr:hypothetical protein [Hymenobacter lapidiphilus]NVO31588.1 hypothetical protein [Hymenobacter lapidiphilus]
MIKTDKDLAASLRSNISLSRPGQQNVSFKELVAEDNAIKSRGTESFTNKFVAAVANQNAHRTTSSVVTTTGNELLNTLVEDGAQIYFPYEELYPSYSEEITVAYDPIDNADVSTGFQYNANGELVEVTVNDLYAQQHPTLIVMEDAAAYVLPDTQLQVMRPTAIGDTVNEVYVGAVRLTKNMDGLFDGNNEVVFVRSDTFIRLNATGQVESGSKGYITKNADVRRYDASNKRWVDKNIFFDSDWDRTEQS